MYVIAMFWFFFLIDLQKYLFLVYPSGIYFSIRHHTNVPMDELCHPLACDLKHSWKKHAKAGENLKEH